MIKANGSYGICYIYIYIYIYRQADTGIFGEYR